MELNYIYNENNKETLKRIPSNSVNTIITSPPYNIGKEYEMPDTLENYVTLISLLFPEYYRILKEDGSIFLQVGNYIENGSVHPLDCYFFYHLKWEGFIPRNRIVWHFGHGLHCTKRFSGRHETILWFTKSDNYKFNLDPIRVPSKYPGKRHFKGPKKGQLSGNPLGKNPSDVWEITNVKHNHPEKTEHPCQFPLELVVRCMLATTDEGDTVYDPYMGSGTTAEAALMYNRNYIGSELRADYCEIANNRLKQIA
jgi:adenine-specific DNA-methyltransferase